MALTASDGGLIVLGSTNAAGNGSNDAFVAKILKDGTFSWSNEYGGSGSDNPGSLYMDGSDNLYASMRVGTVPCFMSLTAVGSGSTGASVNTSIGYGSGINVGGVHLDGSSNIFGQTGATVEQFASGFGTINWQRVLTFSGSTLVPPTTSRISDGTNVWGFINDFTLKKISVVKYNGSGTLQWQRTLSIGVAFDFNYAYVDSSGNSYVVFQNTSAGTGHVAKWNTSGTLQWQRVFSNQSVYVIGMTVDASGNVYVCGQAAPTSPVTDMSAWFIKLDSSGSAVSGCQKAIINTAGNTTDLRSVAVSADGFVYGTGSVPTQSKCLCVGRLPANGSGNATVGSWVYQDEGNVSTGSSSYTEGAGALTDSAGGTGTAGSGISRSTTALSFTGQAI